METVAVRDDARNNWLERFITRTTAIPLPRNLRSKGLRTIVTLVSVTFSLLYIYYAGFGYFSPESFISGYLGFTFVLVFILFPGSEKSPRDRITVFDGILVLSTIAVTYHYNVYFPIRYIERFGEALPHDVIFGIMAIVLALEACRRTLGPALPLISLLLIGYALFGPYFPGHLTHQGISIWDTAAWLYSNQSIYGVITRIFASFVFLFILFGAILEMSGGKELFLNLPLAFIGRTRGGSAKLSAVASALFGMISGSPTANIVGTGTLTIPLMKRSGFPPHVAAAFEATASTIGVTMPPLMGAAIFLMADFTGIPYLEIVKVSILPSLLFMLSLLVVAHLYARKAGIEGLPPEELGNPWEIIRNYWTFAIPLALIFYMLGSGYSPDYAVFVAILGVGGASLLSRRTRLTIPQWGKILEVGARRSLTVGGLAGCLGIIIGIVFRTGIGTKLSILVVDLSGGYLLFAVLLTALVTFVLGMGVSSVTADYLLLSVLIAPALIELGATPMAAHLLIIWYSQTSNLTPPVCGGAFTAAAIAGAHPWRTGFFAFRIGLFIYLIPVAFVFGDLLNPGLNVPFFRTLLTAALSAVCFGGAIIGYLAGPLKIWRRFLLAAATIALFEPRLFFDFIGVLLLALVVLWQILGRRRANQEAA